MAIPLKYNIRNLFVRKVSTTMTVFSIALVITVFITVMALATGLDKTFISSGDDRNVLVIRKSSQVETNSTVTRAEYQIIRYLPGIDPGSDGQPVVSGEVIVLLNLPRKGQAGSSNVIVRGVSPQGFQLRPQLRVVEGRVFRPGFREMIVSSKTAERFQNTAIGQQMKFGKGMWSVVGHFDAEETAFDSELWADADELIAEFGRQGYSSLLLRCGATRPRQELISQINNDRRLQVEADSERDYYERQTLAGIGIKTLATLMTFFMGIGACFAAMNTMYSAVSNRTREIGTLRALGFSRGSILLSFLMEAVFLALIGGLVGCVLALPVNGITTGSSNFNTFSEVTYNFRITLPLILAALVLSGLLGVIGGFFPARTAARQPIFASLRGL